MAAVFGAFAVVDSRPKPEVTVDGRASSRKTTGSSGSVVAKARPTTTTVAVDIDPVAGALIAAAASQVGVTTGYDPAYVKLAFPGGDVPITTGVCSDVIVRAYRGVGVDLQVLLNKDMKANFSKYPTRWGLKRTDPNIDHRRVLNLERFFERQGGKLTVSDDAADYRPGDTVSWSVGGRPHIGLVSSQRVDGTDRFMIIHNVGAGAREEDVLFTWPITAHHRWLPK
jgi:uncharacterized protein